MFLSFFFTHLLYSLCALNNQELHIHSERRSNGNEHTGEAQKTSVMIKLAFFGEYFSFQIIISTKKMKHGEIKIKNNTRVYFLCGFIIKSLNRERETPVYSDICFFGLVTAIASCKTSLFSSISKKEAQKNVIEDHQSVKYININRVDGVGPFTHTLSHILCLYVQLDFFRS